MEIVCYVDDRNFVDVTHLIFDVTDDRTIGFTNEADLKALTQKGRLSKLVNVFLRKVAAVINDLITMCDRHRMTYTREEMITGGIGICVCWTWKEAQLKSTLQKNICKHRYLIFSLQTNLCWFVSTYQFVYTKEFLCRHVLKISDICLISRVVRILMRVHKITLQIWNNSNFY